MFDSIGFIGAGRIAQIMLGGWSRAGVKLPPLLVCDSSDEALAALQAQFPEVRAANLLQVADQSLIFAGLHPPVMADALAQISGHLRRDSVLCSLAPKLHLSKLQEKLGGFARLARMNPNAASIVGKGYNPIAFADGLPQQSRNDLLDLIAPLGQSPLVADESIETYAVVSAMGPTYFWFQFEALRQLAESFGLNPQAAREALAVMLHGAVDTMFASDLTPERVMDLVPVHPMAGAEQAILQMQRESVSAIHAKLHVL